MESMALFDKNSGVHKKILSVQCAMVSKCVLQMTRLETFEIASLSSDW